MNCRKCSKELPADAVFCPYCGIKQEATRAKHKRGNGMGSAYKRGSSWEARIVVRYEAVEGSDPPRKRPVWRTKGGFKTKREALEYCPVLRSIDDKPKAEAPQLTDYWKTYSEGELLTLSKSKQVAYNGAWKKLKGALQYRPVDQITVSELRDTVNAVANTYYTVRDCKTVLTHLFELAGADGWCSKDIPSYILLPKLVEKERQVFTDDEQTALWKLYESGDLRAAIPLLMICTGMMPGEMQKLKVEHIDLENRKIIGVGMKTKVRKESPVYLPKDIIPVVEDLIANAQPSGYIWPRNEDKWYATYYEALEKANCRKLEPYCCRHSTATRLAITEGIAPQTIKRMMRWSTTKMLDRYAHPDDAQIQEAADTITRSDTSPQESQNSECSKKG